MSLGKLLSKRDTVFLLDLIHRSTLCKKEGEFRALIRDLKALIAYDYAICAMENRDIEGKAVFDIVNISYPAGWCFHYLINHYHLVDPIFEENFKHFGVQYWADTYKKTPPPKDFIMIAEDFGLKEGYTFGMNRLQKSEGSLFSLCGGAVERSRRTEAIMHRIMPHFHYAFERISTPYEKSYIPALSRRELEVLNWIKGGKSSWDVSVILGISERTVNFHISNIMQKLGTATRLQAVALAVDLGLINVE
ncbi:MAG TPA: LuxR C-terminal-related transcriptional regulator [Dissulfurispiraceae bacterium]